MPVAAPLRTSLGASAGGTSHTTSHHQAQHPATLSLITEIGVLVRAGSAGAGGLARPTRIALLALLGFGWLL